MRKRIGKEVKFDQLNIFTTQYKSGQRFYPHNDRCYRISVVLSGSLREKSNIGVEEALPFSIVTKPADQKHSNCFGSEGSRLLSIELPPKLLEAPERPSGSLQDYRWLHANYSIQPVIDSLKCF